MGQAGRRLDRQDGGRPRPVLRRHRREGRGRGGPRRGCQVAVHVFGESALEALIDAGVDSIEHGCGLDLELIEHMAGAGHSPGPDDGQRRMELRVDRGAGRGPVPSLRRSHAPSAPRIPGRRAVGPRGGGAHLRRLRRGRWRGPRPRRRRRSCSCTRRDCLWAMRWRPAHGALGSGSAFPASRRAGWQTWWCTTAIRDWTPRCCVHLDVWFFGELWSNDPDATVDGNDAGNDGDRRGACPSGRAGPAASAGRHRLEQPTVAGIARPGRPLRRADAEVPRSGRDECPGSRRTPASSG